MVGTVGTCLKTARANAFITKNPYVCEARHWDHSSGE